MLSSLLMRAFFHLFVWVFRGGFVISDFFRIFVGAKLSGVVVKVVKWVKVVKPKANEAKGIDRKLTKKC